MIDAAALAQHGVAQWVGMLETWMPNAQQLVVPRCANCAATGLSVDTSIMRAAGGQGLWSTRRQDRAKPRPFGWIAVVEHNRREVITMGKQQTPPPKPPSRPGPGQPNPLGKPH